MTEDPFSDGASPRVRDAPQARYETWLSLVLIAAGVGLRLWIRHPTDFWEDEIIAVTHAVQPFWDVVIDTVRNDVHPPLYFLQLHVWSLLGRSDLWLTANSVLWGFLALFSLWFVARKCHGARVALLAAAIFAVLPSALYMADQLRMYAMLATLTVWAYYFARRIFEGEDRRWPNWIGLGALLLAIINTHAIGSIAVLANGLYAASLILEKRSGPKAWTAWLLLYGVCAAAALPWLVSGMLHDANLPERPGLAGFVLDAAATAIGNIAFRIAPLQIFGALLFLVIVALGVLTRPARATTLAFLVLPLALGVLAALFLKPIFKWNFFSTIAAPYLAIVLALAVCEARARQWQRILAWACILCLCAIAIVTRLTMRESSGFRTLAQVIRENYRPGDIVYVPQLSVFWGMAWYLEGPDWGSSLAIAPPPSAQWRSVYAKLGPRIVDSLGLMPRAQLVEGRGVSLLVGNNSAGQAQSASRVWLVTLPRADLAPGYPPARFNGMPPRWTLRRNTEVTLYAAEAVDVRTPADEPDR